MNQLPTITTLPGSLGERTTYRLEGGTLPPDWARYVFRSIKPRDGVWCEIVFEGEWIVAYSGTVYPLAWPELFEWDRGRTRPTEAWWAAVSQRPSANAGRVA